MTVVASGLQPRTVEQPACTPSENVQVVMSDPVRPTAVVVSTNVLVTVVAVVVSRCQCPSLLLWVRIPDSLVVVAVPVWAVTVFVEIVSDKGVSE